MTRCSYERLSYNLHLFIYFKRHIFIALILNSLCEEMCICVLKKVRTIYVAVYTKSIQNVFNYFEYFKN